MPNLSENLFSDFKINEASAKIKILFDNLNRLSVEVNKMNSAASALNSSFIKSNRILSTAGDDPKRKTSYKDDPGYKLYRTIVDNLIPGAQKTYDILEAYHEYSNAIHERIKQPKSDLERSEHFGSNGSLQNYFNWFGKNAGNHPWETSKETETAKKNQFTNRKKNKSSEETEKYKTRLDELNASLEKNQILLQRAETQTGKASEQYFYYLEIIEKLNEEIAKLKDEHNEIADALTELNADPTTLKQSMLETKQRQDDAEEEAEYEIAKINAELIGNTLEKNIALIRLELEKELEKIAGNNLLSVSTRRRLGKAKKEEAERKIKNLQPDDKDNKKDKTNFADVLAEKFKQGLDVANEIVKVLKIESYTFFAQMVDFLNKALPIAETAGNVLKFIGLVSTGGLSGAFGFLGSVFSIITSFLGFASGGVVPGSGNRDTIPAMLTPGEFVISKPNVSRLISAFGNNFLSFLNPSTMLPSLPGHYALGGMVSNMPAPANINLKVEFDDMKLKLNTLYTAVKKQQTIVKRGHLL